MDCSGPPSTWNATRALLDCAVDGVAANCRLFSSPSGVSRSGWLGQIRQVAPSALVIPVSVIRLAGEQVNLSVKNAYCRPEYEPTTADPPVHLVTVWIAGTSSTESWNCFSSLRMLAPSPP